MSDRIEGQSIDRLVVSSALKSRAYRVLSKKREREGDSPYRVGSFLQTNIGKHFIPHPKRFLSGDLHGFISSDEL